MIDGAACSKLATLSFEFVTDYRQPRDILKRFEWYLKNWRGSVYGCIGEIWKGGIGWKVNRNEKLFLKFDSRDSFAEEDFLYRDLSALLAP